MATAGICRHCLRRMSTARVPNALSRQSRTLASSQRHLHIQSPLYLNFLAPSWPASRQDCKSHKTNISAPASQRRSISSTAPKRATAIANPRKDEEGNEMIINITPRAAHRLQTIAETDGNPKLALRVSVESGGCHGFQYLMSLVNTEEIDAEEDTLFENEEVARKEGDYKAKIVIDEPSLELLKGSSIDYTMELIGSQFKVTGIPGATSSCGCGTSFDIAG